MIPSFLKEKETVSPAKPSSRRNFNFVDRTAKNMAAFLLTSMQQWNTSRRTGLLQGLDARKSNFCIGLRYFGEPDA
ncbi:MAG: hypothetical protein IPJ40_09590 [Saprospirales bacterium]|nr:hypothetical protein [Saprospirales bacterium]